MRWRKAIVAVHRDLGYFFAGLTVIYAVSGVAVNHIDDWNPSYAVTRETVELGPLADDAVDIVAAEALRRLGVETPARSVVKMSPAELRIFLDGRTFYVGLPDGRTVDERVRRRFVFFEANHLHLNRGKGIWTWIADVYALGLAVLACTGIFIVSGRKGLGGRGRWLLAAGLAVPLLYLALAL